MSDDATNAANGGTCELCGADADERCDDGACRECHKSLTFEDCVSGEWTRRQRRAAGLPTEAENG